jgi:pimeloyl-ACP methyl ester carboxylesterase
MLAYETSGSGAPLLLIHGLTESRRMWDPLLPALAEDHTVLAVDLPGHGESGPGASYAPDAMADEVAAVVRSVGMDAPTVVGHSLGGVVATVYGAAHPARCVLNIDQSLALADFKDAVMSIEAQLRGDEATFLATINAMLGAMEGPMSPAESARMRALRRPDQAVVLAIWAPVMEASAADLDALVRSFAGQVKVPYLALHGSDPGPGYVAWLSEVIPQATVEVWPDEGHYPHLIEPDRFVNRLRDFEGALQA